MSIIPPGISNNLQFYLSGPAPCPYLPMLIERKLFTRLDTNDTELNTEINAALCRVGFRRSHDVVYRPACTACNACIPVRIPVMLFMRSRTQRKIAARNADLHWQRAETKFSEELFALFNAYQTSRHSDSDMARMTRDDFTAMLTEGNADTRLYQLRDSGGALQACIIGDFVGDGFSAVYSFFNTAEPRRSLGTQLVLSLINEAITDNLGFIYLGYWVREARKMAYKSHFKPLQFLSPSGWSWLQEEDNNANP